MKFSAVVLSCRQFDYICKSDGISKKAYSVHILLSNYEEYSVISYVPYDEGESCIMLIRAGRFNKPVISLCRSYFAQPGVPFD